MPLGINPSRGPEIIRNTQMNIVRNVFWGVSEMECHQFFQRLPFSHSGEEEAGTAHQKRKAMKPHSRTVSSQDDTKHAGVIADEVYVVA
jgi:hypothetical protein